MAEAEILAYLAGVFDGEGCVNIGRDRGRLRLRVVVSMTTPGLPALSLFAATFGGKVTSARSRSGCSREHRWCLSGSAASDALHCLSPWLRVKAPHARAAISFAADSTTGTQTLDTMRALNSRGR